MMEGRGSIFAETWENNEVFLSGTLTGVVTVVSNREGNQDEIKSAKCHTRHLEDLTARRLESRKYPKLCRWGYNREP